LPDYLIDYHHRARDILLLCAKPGRFIKISCLDKQFSRRLAQALSPFGRDQDRFRQFKPAIIEPKGRHEMQGHVGLKHGFVTPADGHGALAPIRRIGKPNGIASA
jgi:hypothetical protein